MSASRVDGPRNVRAIMTHGELDHWHALRRAVGDARLLGGVFTVVGALFLIPALIETRGLVTKLLTASASLLLLGPGILYWIAASSLGRRKPAGAVLARRAAVAHVLAIVGSGALGLIAGALDTWGWGLFFPAFVAAFFVPALVAFLVQARAALRAARVLDDSGRAFEPLVVAQPVLQPKLSDPQHNPPPPVT